MLPHPFHPHGRLSGHLGWEEYLVIRCSSTKLVHSGTVPWYSWPHTTCAREMPTMSWPVCLRAGLIFLPESSPFVTISPPESPPPSLALDLQQHSAVSRGLTYISFYCTRRPWDEHVLNANVDDTRSVILLWLSKAQQKET